MYVNLVFERMAMWKKHIQFRLSKDSVHYGLVFMALASIRGTWTYP